MSHHKHKSRSSSCSSDSRYRKKRSRKHPYRRSRSSRSSTSGSSVTSASSKHFDKKADNQNTAWENIVLHYLSKLKNYWTSVYNAKPASKRNSETDGIAAKNVDRLDLVNEMPPFEQENYCQTGKRKALNIVSNALEYGLANGIVSQNGNYFWIKDKLVPKDKISNPRMPPSKCGSCHCNSLSKSALAEKKSSTSSPPPAKMALSKKSVKLKVGKTRGIRKKGGVPPAGKLRKKRGPGCSGFLNKCKCSKCKSIFKLL